MATVTTGFAEPTSCSARPGGQGSYSVFAVLLALAAVWTVLSTGYELYLVPDTVIGPGTVYFCLAALSFAALYQTSVCHEIWLDPATRRYRACWNRLSVGQVGTFADIAGVSVKASTDGKRHEVWLDWKSFDRNPLLLAADSDAGTAQSFAASFSAMPAGSEETAETQGHAPQAGPRPKRNQQWSVIGGTWLLILSFPFAGAALHDLRAENAYSDRGVSAQARVIGRSREYYRGHAHYYVSYELTVRSRTLYGRSQTSWSHYADAEDGSAFAVEYLPEDPRVNRAVGDASNVGVALLAGFLGIGGVGCLHIVYGLRLIRTPGVDVS